MKEHLVLELVKEGALPVLEEMVKEPTSRLLSLAASLDSVPDSPGTLKAQIDDVLASVRRSSDNLIRLSEDTSSRLPTSRSNGAATTNGATTSDPTTNGSTEPRPADPPKTKRKSSNVNGFLIVNLIRKWKKIIARKRMRQRRDSGEHFEEDGDCRYESKPAEVEAVLWAAIQKNYMLNKMEKIVVREFVRVMKRIVVPVDTFLVRQGEPCRDFFVVVSGLVDAQMYKLGSGGKESLVGTFRAGQSFGERALVTDDRSPTTLRARTEAHLYTLTHSEFSRIVNHFNQAKITLQFLHEVSVDCNNLFANLPAGELADLALQFTYMCVRPKAKLIRQGKPNNAWYIIRKGTVDVLKDGNYIRTLGEAQWFGEASIINKEGANADIVAGEHCELMRLSEEHCRTIFPKLAFKETYLNSLKLSAMRAIPVPLMKEMTMEAIGNCKDFQETTFSAGSVMVMENQPPEFFYIITSGEVKVVKYQEPIMVPAAGGYPQMYSPPPMVVATLKSGETVGSRALLYNERYNVSALAHTQVNCLRLSREAFNSLVLTARRREWYTLIQSWPLFASLKEPVRAHIVKHMNFVKCQQGEAVVRQGDKGGRFYFIKEGECVVMKTEAVAPPASPAGKGSPAARGLSSPASSPAPRPKVVMRLGVGAFFGEQAVLMGQGQPYSVLTAGPVELLWVSGDIFQQAGAALQILLWQHIAWTNSKNRKVCSPIEERIRDANLKLEDLQIGVTLGKGQFGRVRLATSKKTQMQYALKQLKKRDVIQNGQVEHLRTETMVLNEIEHPFCNKLVATFKDSRNLYMLITLCQGGDLLKLQDRWPKGRIPNQSVKFYMACVVLALEYLHSIDIAYRDLKQENVMLDADGYVKVVDYGLSKRVRGTDQTYTLCGTPQFLAPEIITCLGHDKTVDMWSLGVLTYELLAGDSPFVDESQGDDTDDVFAAIVDGQYKLPPPPIIQADAADFIVQLLKRDPTKRLGAGPGGWKAVKDHRWFANINWDALVRKQIEAPFLPDIANVTDTFGTHRESVCMSPGPQEAEEEPEDERTKNLLDDIF
mmetsp:Transcript_14646/g.31383  ORF Transcript_14646/g.31383 Transcript_14646/m.31383 type:complete len:1053 (-) Transcript_14646:420-3578(-)|eukprot:CAMPEP_0118924756 /NCGR_PEP_ID=MMETSP1169-20130426/2740_1 /TAXON_ID=36882 /ORGANISM="Pyramimonas obovata, Strain CCMP722" /LENGTH=1052 /DNA_ID=CAMNT_0006865887 /DNA_START=284 /DNA_END=3442 /DNA_ORIENTATION=+